MLLKLNPVSPLLFSTAFALSLLGCSSQDRNCAFNDVSCDGVPDDLGVAVDADDIHGPDHWDINGDGVADGYQVDRNGDGQPDALGLDLDADGLVDAVDWNLDGFVDEFVPDGTYGTGKPGLVGGDPNLPIIPAENCLNDGGVHGVPYSTSSRYEKIDVTRGATSYRLITNGWGENWVNHAISGQGTQMRVNSFEGGVGVGSSPAGYPTVYYGDYSNTGVSTGALLPRAISSISSVHTGLKWSHPAATGAYNVAWDVWLSQGGAHSGYFMVWLRDPPGFKPAGSSKEKGIIVSGVNGYWDIWAGSVTVEGVSLPIINYVRTEGSDSYELGFNLIDFFNDATSRAYTLPGTEIMSVAIGFEIWQGPVADLGINDFCVTVN